MSTIATGNARRFNWGRWFAWSVCALVSIATVWLAIREAPLFIGRNGLLGLFVYASRAMLPLTFSSLGALIITHQPGNRIGWLMLLPALATFVDVSSELFVDPMTVPPAEPSALVLIAIWAGRVGWVWAIFPLFLILLLFPTGRPPSPRWRILVLALVALLALLLLIVGFGRHLLPFDEAWQVANPIGFIPDVWVERLYSRLLQQLLGVLALLCAASLYVRYRRGTVVERTQIKWIAYTSTLLSLFLLVAVLTLTTTGRGWDDPVGMAVQAPSGLMLLATPVAITIAILRHHLFDIHLIVRRTLVYAVLTGVLGAIYLLTIVTLQALFVRLTGQTSTLAVVASTLAIAALFQPLRRGVQVAVDRRFDRTRYDARLVLEQFADRAQHEADLDALSADLLATVDQALKPSQVQLWLVRRDRRVP
ncbi:MAG TPA: hypothetical protein VFU22_22735 [Roseiflexaceae bacterium]|nr:hypothetical protein [Roseiflexaceae bacterium]